MKNILLLLSIIFFTSCKNNSEIQTIVEQQSEIEKLKTENQILHLEIEKLKTEENIKPSRTAKNNVSYEKRNTGNQNQAKLAIKGYMEMYHSGKEYNNVKAVSKTDGTVDIIFDVITRYDDGPNKGSVWLRNKKYFNVSTFGDETYKINKEWGVMLY
jgi:regulator of replication initiation timing